MSREKRTIEQLLEIIVGQNEVIMASIQTAIGTIATDFATIQANQGILAAAIAALPAGGNPTVTASVLTAADQATLDGIATNSANLANALAAKSGTGPSGPGTPTVLAPIAPPITIGTAGTIGLNFGTPVPPATTSIAFTGTLPAGLSFVDNGNGTATIAGTPAAGSVTTPITVTATSSTGSVATQVVTLTVAGSAATNPPAGAPVFTSAPAVNIKANQGSTFTITTNPAATSLSFSGTLPTGVTFTDNGDGTATLATTNAEAPGVTPLTITANNAAGTAAQSLVLTLS